MQGQKWRECVEAVCEHQEIKSMRISNVLDVIVHYGNQGLMLFKLKIN